MKALPVLFIVVFVLFASGEIPNPAESLEVQTGLQKTGDKKCEHGFWSPQSKKCMDDQEQAEEPMIACETGTWSPALKTCVSD